MNKRFADIACCLPYAFLSMFADAKWGSMAGYAISAICIGLICIVTTGKKPDRKFVLGNATSLILSLILSANLNPDSWDAYFKPFAPHSLICIITAAIIAIQLIFRLRKRR